MGNRQAIRDSLRYEGGVSRRFLLAYAGALGALPLLGRASWANPKPQFSANPFSLGVASGDPDSSGFVLWTRLAPDPLAVDGGMPPEAVEVRWEVATDDTMRTIVASGVAPATPQLGHSVHVEVEGLSPDRWYWYRFRAGDAESPIGRTRTFPAADTLPQMLRFAVTSCQNYEQGLYTAYEQMAKDDVDLVCHLGDYIYERESGRTGKVRSHIGPEIETLGDYRVRHSQYRSDPLLRTMHEVCPWVVTWDDHEVDNNYANDVSEQDGVDPVDFLTRRSNAYQAYYEMMPLRARSLPRGSDMTLYRNCSYGQLAALMVLDTRQYRSDQANGDKRKPLNEAALATSQSILGREQRNWLCNQLITSRATWNVLAQQVMMGMVGHAGKGGETLYSMDQWPGYADERMRLMRFIADRRVSNPVVLTGDIHTNWVNELRVDDRMHDQPIVATEFVATSLSSGGNGPEKPKTLDAIVSANPCVKFHNGERGYIRCTVTPQSWKSDYMVVDDVLKPGGNTFQRASFIIESGNPAVQPA